MAIPLVTISKSKINLVSEEFTTAIRLRELLSVLDWQGVLGALA